jgi:WD40 repeat protein
MVVGGGVALASLEPTPGEVYRVWLDGRTTNVSQSPADDTAPVVSPDGTRIAFVSNRGEGVLGPEHIFLIGSDGRGLVEVGPALEKQDFSFALSWSPDGRTLAVAAAAAGQKPKGEVWSLYLITPGASVRVLAKGPPMYNPAWSPDGRVIGVSTTSRVWGVTPAGKVTWRLKGFTYLQGGRSWSATGRLALLRRGRIGVYDEQGRLRVPFFRGRSFAWAPNGKRLASIAGNRLEVRSHSGRVLFRKAVPSLRGHNGLVWADSRHVVIGGIGPSSRAITIDLVRGRLSPGSLRDFGLRSPDGRLVAETVNIGSGFALRVSRVDGSKARTLATRSDCPDLIENDVRWFPDGQSLVYDFACQSR